MIDWGCADCSVNTREEYYMVHDHIWEQYGSEPFLCIGCLEDRMGRELWSGDFTHWPINNVNQWDKSDRLYDRLTRSHLPEPKEWTTWITMESITGKKRRSWWGLTKSS